MSLSRILNDPSSPITPSASIPLSESAPANDDYVPSDVRQLSETPGSLSNGAPSMATPSNGKSSSKPPSRKRKRGNDSIDASANQGQRRFSSRIHSQSLRESTAEAARYKTEDAPEFIENEVNSPSSDLEDCPEIWQHDLSNYIVETQKRQQRIQVLFEANMVKFKENAIQFLNQRYTSRLARMPDPRLIQSRNFANGVNDDSSRSPLRPSSPRNAAEYNDHSHGGNQNGRSASFLEQPSKAAVGRRKNAAADEGSQTSKRRKIAGDDDNSLSMKLLKGKNKKRDGSVDSVSTVSREPRKKTAARKLAGTEAGDSAGLAPFDARDDDALDSRPASPFAVSNVIFEIGDDLPPLRRAKKVDDNTMAKRMRAMQETQRKVWTSIARKDIPKVYKLATQGWNVRQMQSKRLATLASIQARKPYTKTVKSTKDVQTRGKKLMREIMTSWKRNEKEERDVKKRENKEAQDRAKLEDEKREAARHARKLEFLISQTELYSHFVGSKLKTSELQGEGEGASSSAPAGALLDDVDASHLKDINFDDEDTTNLHQHARHNAQEALAKAKSRAKQFDVQAALERKTNVALKLTKGQAHIHQDEEMAKGPLVDLDSDELNFQNPTMLQGALTIGQPRNLMAQLKEYQLKGLNWLAMLYEQGINGILADEMGLGKTVQSISLLAHLAETHNIWGPFLVVSPASTLHNWQQELTRFLPNMKAIPYWGTVKDRQILRKIWCKKDITYNKDAPFHILITSYQLVTVDQQYFQKINWQYMILDEAQNIKNSNSVRWRTLLGFNTRNRLLLTGTPIQNSMQELWALLHFIMPSLFDSHDEFNEWFSKDIESAAENKGSKLNEHQLRRLHMILKPFMLRRIKRNVQNELSEKIEKDIYIDLSARQRKLYTGMLANVSVADLMEKASGNGDSESTRALMNLVMQFRKVCNHPELFERADVVAPFSFARFGQSGPISHERGFISLEYSTRNPIEYHVPKLFILEGGLLDIPSERSKTGILAKLMNIWSTDRIQRSLYDEDSSNFGFSRFLQLSPSEVHSGFAAPLILRSTRHLQSQTSMDLPASNPWSFAPSANNICALVDRVSGKLPNQDCIATSSWETSPLSRSILRWYIPPVVAPPIPMYCSMRSFLDWQSQVLACPLESLALFGLPVHMKDDAKAWTAFQSVLPNVPAQGLFEESPRSQLPYPPMRIPEAKSLIYDSAKLARLDALLQDLKSENHRVLIYFQMTRMMDLMEEYLVYRQYKYLRLDGSSKLEDRRDMVMDWQTNPDIFIFILSTRAGGLGINLTAADTVIFYDHDWNPSNDAQAMDRAHRLGQTRQVTVYRLITKGTIDERIVQLARVKKDVQDLVVGQKNFTDSHKPSEIMQLLLNDEQLKNLESRPADSSSGKGKQKAKDTSQEQWNYDGDDDFFGSGANSGSRSANQGHGSTVDDEGAEGEPGPKPSARKRGAGAGSRKKKPADPDDKPAPKRRSRAKKANGDS